MATISTVLGDSREVTKFYSDGSFDCPYCHNAVIRPTTQCDNPWCDAHPNWSPKALGDRRIERAFKEAAQAREAETRRQVNEAARQRHLEHQQWTADQYAEAERRGACLNCVIQSGWERAKFIKHRGLCPKQR